VILPYYKIEKTEEGQQFFFTHVGYFNFWDEYLIMNVGLEYKIYAVLVNRPNSKLSNPEPTVDFEVKRNLHIANSIVKKQPREMFIDFPEFKKFNLLNGNRK